MSIIHKVVYYLNDVLVSLDIAPITKVENKSEKQSNTTKQTDINI